MFDKVMNHVMNWVRAFVDIVTILLSLTFVHIDVFDSSVIDIVGYLWLAGLIMLAIEHFVDKIVLIIEKSKEEVQKEEAA